MKAISAPLLFLFIFLFQLPAHAQIINKIAGAGTYGFSGDGGPAVLAEFFNTRGVAIDPATNDLYVSDYGNNCIRKVAYPSGIISTIAGIPTSGGYSGDGGPAVLAQISLPWGLAVDPLSNCLYISDFNNYVVRKVDLTTGIISTVAGNGTYGYSGDGGPATLAQVAGITGVAVDASGNLYMADQGNSVIRMVDGSGTIYTVAGNNTAGYSGDGGPAISAQLNYPSDVAIDPSGNLYIGDVGNNVVRIVDPSGTINTFAGNGTPGYSGDGGPATSAQLKSPNGVAADAFGNVYIGDLSNIVVRKVDASGIITTYAGNGTSGFAGDGGPAILAELYEPEKICTDPAGCLYITGKYENRVRVVCGDSAHHCYDDAKLDVKSYIDDKGNCIFTATANVVTSNYIVGYQWQGVGGAVIHHTHLSSNSYTFMLPPGGSATISVTIYMVDTNFNDTSKGPCCQAYLTADVKCDGKGKKFARSSDKTTTKEAIAIFPNPTEDAVTVRSSKEPINTIQVIDVNGKKVASYNYDGTQNANISLEKLPPGNYLLRINNQTSKVISKSK